MTTKFLNLSICVAVAFVMASCIPSPHPHEMKGVFYEDYASCTPLAGAKLDLMVVYDDVWYDYLYHYSNENQSNRDSVLLSYSTYLCSPVTDNEGKFAALFYTDNGSEFFNQQPEGAKTTILMSCYYAMCDGKVVGEFWLGNDVIYSLNQNTINITVSAYDELFVADKIYYCIDGYNPVETNPGVRVLERGEVKSEILDLRSIMRVINPDEIYISWGYNPNDLCYQCCFKAPFDNCELKLYVNK